MSIALILLPLLAAGWALVRRGAGPGLALLTVIANLLLSVLAAVGVGRQGVQTFEAGLVFVADGLSSVLLVAAAVTETAVVLYAASFWGKDSGSSPPPFFWPLLLLQLGGLNGIFLAGDLLTISVCSEIVGLSAVAMIIVSGGPEARGASIRYLYIRIPASGSQLLGALLLFTAYGSFQIRTLHGMLEPSGLVPMAMALMMFAVLVKSALFPMHFWLPPAHSAAAAPAGAILSAIAIKAPVYMALRFWFHLFETVGTRSLAQFIGILGAAAILWGAAQALRQSRLKLLLAHSTVSQIGYLFLLFPLLTGATSGVYVSLTWTGGIYQAVSHALAKAAMLLAAGVTLRALGTDSLRGMHGTAGRLPVTTMALGLAGITLIGLPPSGGFVAKWLLLKAALESGQWWWIPVLIAGGLLTAGYAFLMLAYAFQPRRDVPGLRRPPRLLELSALVLALTAFLIGLRVEEPMRLLSVGFPLPSLGRLMP
jgi:multicomponent Na+:H+ antiporter subunit D